VDIFSTARLAQQVYPERVQTASEPPVYPHEQYQGMTERPAVGKTTAGWRDLLSRIGSGRALAWLRS